MAEDRGQRLLNAEWGLGNALTALHRVSFSFWRLARLGSAIYNLADGLKGISR